MSTAEQMFIKLGASKILGILMNVGEKKSKISEKSNKTTMSEKERFKGKLEKAENKSRANVAKARSKKAGNEPVSDQKAHEYH